MNNEITCSFNNMRKSIKIKIYLNTILITSKSFVYKLLLFATLFLFLQKKPTLKKVVII